MYVMYYCLNVSCLAAGEPGGVLFRAQLLVGLRGPRNLQRNEEVAGEHVVVKVTERWWRMKLAGGDPSVRISPLPVGG